jgi:hypothetical protein
MPVLRNTLKRRVRPNPVVKHIKYNEGENLIRVLKKNGLRGSSPGDDDDYKAIEWSCMGECRKCLRDCVVFHALLFLLFLMGKIPETQLTLALTQKGHKDWSVNKVMGILNTPYAPTQLKEYLENMYSNMTGGSYPTERELEQLKMQLPLPLPQ